VDREAWFVCTSNYNHSVLYTEVFVCASRANVFTYQSSRICLLVRNREVKVSPKHFFASSPRLPKKRYAIRYLFCIIPCWLQYGILSSDRYKGLRENGLVCSQGTLAPVCCESENNSHMRHQISGIHLRSISTRRS
jgi:hypothetical protein